MKKRNALSDVIGNLLGNIDLEPDPSEISRHASLTTTASNKNPGTIPKDIREIIGDLTLDLD